MVTDNTPIKVHIEYNSFVEKKIEAFNLHLSLPLDPVFSRIHSRDLKTAVPMRSNMEQ